MVVVGIETSGNGGSIALFRDGQVIQQRDLSASGRRHARTLVPELGALLRDHELTPRDVTRLAVSVGPGSFTGLRVGIVCAKTFAYATGCQLAAVETFAAVAAAQQSTTPLWVIDDALREEVYAARYEYRADHWECVLKLGIVPVAEFAAQAQGQLVTGPGVHKHLTALHGCEFAAAEHRHPQAAHIAQLGAAQSTAELADLWTLSPFYIRRSAAEEKADATSLIPPPGDGR